MTDRGQGGEDKYISSLPVKYPQILLGNILPNVKNVLLSIRNFLCVCGGMRKSAFSSAGLRSNHSISPSPPPRSPKAKGSETGEPGNEVVTGRIEGNIILDLVITASNAPSPQTSYHSPSWGKQTEQNPQERDLRIHPALFFCWKDSQDLPHSISASLFPYLCAPMPKNTSGMKAAPRQW